MEKTRWEYQIIKFEMPDDWPIGIDKWEGIRISHLKLLNEMGQQGWEYTHSLGYLYYFKRPMAIEPADPAYIDAAQLEKMIDKILVKDLNLNDRNLLRSGRG